MKKHFVVLPVLFFLLQVAFPNEPSPAPLPTFPDKAAEIIARKQMLQEHIEVSPIVWDMNWHTGIQQLSIINSPLLPDLSTELSEVIYTSNQYKGAVISVDVSPFFTIYSNFSIGFQQGNFPKNFSISTIPYFHSTWTSLESDSFIAKKIPLKESFTIAPYTGYMFSQYDLYSAHSEQKFSSRIYHSAVIGSKFIFQPTRIFFIETSVAFSPITAVNRKLLSTFQINYEGIFTFTTKNLTLSLILSTRNNIEYKGISPESITLRISKIGFHFRFSI